MGVGNAVVTVDASADLDDAADKIVLSKTLDLAASCSSDNALVVLDAVYDEMLAKVFFGSALSDDCRRAPGSLSRAHHDDESRTRLLRAKLVARGGLVLDAAQKAKLAAATWIDGHINAAIVAQEPAFIAEVAGFAVPEV